jgi:hypothetical protein
LFSEVIQTFTLGLGSAKDAQEIIDVMNSAHMVQEAYRHPAPEEGSRAGGAQALERPSDGVVGGALPTGQKSDSDLTSERSFGVRYRGKSLQLLVGQMGLKLCESSDDVSKPVADWLYQSLHGWNWQPSKGLLRINYKVPPKKAGKPEGSKWAEIAMQKLDGQTAQQLIENHAKQLASEARAKLREAKGIGMATQPVSPAFSSDSILTEIYLCHACSDHETVDGNARTGRWW